VTLLLRKEKAMENHELQQWHAIEAEVSRAIGAKIEIDMDCCLFKEWLEDIRSEEPNHIVLHLVGHFNQYGLIGLMEDYPVFVSGVKEEDFNEYYRGVIV